MAIGTMINPNTVLDLLRKEFTTYPDAEAPSVSEKEVAKLISRLLRRDDIFVEEIQTLDFYPVMDSDEEDEDIEDIEKNKEESQTKDKATNTLQRQESDESQSSTSSDYKPPPKKNSQIWKTSIFTELTCFGPKRVLQVLGTEGLGAAFRVISRS